FVAVLLGPQWLPVAPIVSIIAVAGIFRSLAQVTYWIYLARGLVKEQLRLYAVTQAVIVVSICAGIPWGVIGIAIGCVFGYAVFWAAGLWHVARVTPIATVTLVRRSCLILSVIALPVGLLAAGISSVVADYWAALVISVFVTIV